jgi:hypothetical protein
MAAPDITPQPSTSLSPARTSEIEEQRDPLVVTAKAFEIVDQETYVVACAALTDQIQPLIKKVEASCKPVKAAAYAVHKAASTQERLLLAPLLEAKSIYNALIGRWTAKVAEEQRIANKAIEEARARDEAARIKAAQVEAEERQIDAAAELEANGDDAGAQRVLETPASVHVEAPAPAQQAPAVQVAAKGISTKVVYSGEVVDTIKLLEGVLAGKIPRKVLKIDQGALNVLIRAADGEVDYPGVRVVSENKVTSRARKD